MLKLSKEDRDYREFLKWKAGKEKKRSHKFRNFILILVVALTLWFVLDKNSFIAFWRWVFGLF